MLSCPTAWKCNMLGLVGNGLLLSSKSTIVRLLSMRRYQCSCPIEYLCHCHMRRKLTPPNFHRISWIIAVGWTGRSWLWSCRWKCMLVQRMFLFSFECLVLSMYLSECHLRNEVTHSWDRSRKMNGRILWRKMSRRKLKLTKWTVWAFVSLVL